MKPVVRATALLGLVFTAGVTVGVALSDRIEEWSLPGLPAERLDYDDDLEDVIDVETRIINELGLMERQSIAIDRILVQRESTLVAYWSDRIPDMQRILDTARADIRSLLTPEQIARYDEGLAALAGRRTSRKSR